MDSSLKKRLGLKPKSELLKLPHKRGKGLNWKNNGRKKEKLPELPCRKWKKLLRSSRTRRLLNDLQEAFSAYGEVLKSKIRSSQRSDLTRPA
ncbi:conserved hypothetical protein [Ricinus communis]|uniref:Uncharacterized protein n=1 Tax=Ricinus communis TaxID=3988 RepID=B9R7V5_RICCO|nr:conserved hypothetical protein [Ricinus communis]